MQIVCPACQAVYEVPQAVLMATPRVQCARCDNDWAPSLHPEPLPGPPPRPTAMSDADFAGRASADVSREPLAPPLEKAPLELAPLLGWAASLVLLIGLAWAGLHWRDHVMHAWPASTRLFAALGLRSPAM